MHSTKAQRIGARISIALGVVLFTAVIAGPVQAEKFTGTKKADRLTGTAKSDALRGKGGKDKIKGKNGKDRLAGGGGNDRLVGGKGADKMSGGKGADFLNAADGAKDKTVNGGAGKDRCKIDTTDVPKNCEKLSGPGAAGGGGSGGGSGGDGSGGGSGGDGSGGGSGGGDGGLTVTSSSGTSCASSLPTCPFQIAGGEADALVGLVTGGGGVSVAAGPAVSISAPDWTATGLYGCTEDGFLRVTIGSKTADVPVDCTV